MTGTLDPVADCDVVIVGAGPSGAVAAQRLAGRGLRVVVLEQGGYPDYTLAPADKAEWSLARDRWMAWDPNKRQSDGDYAVDDSDSEVTPLMWNGVGGSSVLYAAAWHRLKPSDFKVRTMDGVGADWPIGYRDLVPYYEQVERAFAVSGVGGDPAYPDGFDIPMPPMPLEDLERRFTAAHARLGWHIWPGSNAIATQRFGVLEPCVRRGACMWGCFDGAKASVDRTHWPENIQLGVHLRQRARALRVEHDAGGRATGVVYVDRETGTEHFQAARTVLLGANGIGTPRILLNSASNLHPDGLGNSSGLLGKNLMMHPLSTVIGLFGDFFESWQGPLGQRMYSLEFSETDPARDHVRGAKWQLMGSGSPLNVAGSYPFGTSAWGAEFHQLVRQRFGRSAFWGIIAEDLPHESNLVELAPDVLDDAGMPTVRVHFKTDDNTERLLRFHEEKATESMCEAGAYDVVISPQIREIGWHMLGTARMGTDPRTSVTNEFGRLHDVPNVFVLDGSVMPTSGCVNPTGTVAALALRTADHLLETHVLAGARA